MAPRLRTIHSQYGRELETVGRILSDYGELEIDLLHCMAITEVAPFNDIFKSMFADRGELRRITIAANYGRSEYIKCGLQAEFDQMISAMSHCRLIRNQYAHAYWHNPSEGLCFVDLETLAKEARPIDSLIEADFRYVNAALLDEQEDFLTHAQRWISHVNYERRRRLKLLNSQQFPKPKSRRQPALFLSETP